MLTDADYHRLIEDEGYPAMLAYADALEEWGNRPEAEGWRWIVSEEKKPWKSGKFNGWWCWFSDPNPGIKSELPIKIYRLLSSPLRVNSVASYYSSEFGCFVAAARAYGECEWSK